jgi:23S rRNA (uracil1939-C5)-methyltransferase
MRELTVERLGIDGEGVAEGLRVPFALPGERLLGTVADGAVAIAELIEASPARAAPPCRHFGTCGGCALQHATDGFVAEWKRAAVSRALLARGLATEVRPVLTSPARSRRRAVFAGRRTRKTTLVGFFGRRSEVLVDVDGCHVLRPAIVAAGPALAELVAAGAPRSRAVRLTVTEGPAGLDIDMAGGRPADAALGARLAALAEAHDLARLCWDGEPIVQRRTPFQRMGRARVVPPPGAFLQATAEGEAALLAAVRAAVGDARRMADLFAGCGTFALPLAERAEVRAVEADAAMTAALDAAWRATPGLRRVAAERRDLFRRPLLPDELAGVDAVVIDPPRAGAEAQCRALARSRVPVVAAVSCDPRSFARDAGLLAEGGFRLDWVQPVDQFRWSGHVELAARFSR